MKKQYRSRRVAAYILDWFLSCLIYSFIGLAYYSIITQIKASRIDFHNLSFYQGMVLLIICLIIFVIYYIVVPYYNDGQTIGKRILRLRVINENQKINFLTVHIIRFICLLFLEGFLFYPSTVFIQFIECFFSEDIASLLYRISTFTTIISLFIGILKNKMLHDYLSFSQVILE